MDAGKKVVDSPVHLADFGEFILLDPQGRSMCEWKLFYCVCRCRAD